jgi:hypothetical protein
MRRPFFASLEGKFFGGKLMTGFTFFIGKSNAVGMLTKKKISIAHSVFAGLWVTNQATAKFSMTKPGYLAICSIWPIIKVFHAKILELIGGMSSPSF